MERYKCKYCDNTYASMSSRSNHNKKVHRNPVVECCSSVVDNSELNVVNGCSAVVDSKKMNNICKYCKENFCDRTYRWRHEKICKLKDVNILKDNKEIVTKEIIDNIKKQLLEDEDLRTEILKSLKIHPKQLQKINNQLNQQNIQNNNTTYVQLGYENFQEMLSNKKKLGILNRQANSINQFVEMIYQNKDFKPYQNVYITNLRSKTAYKYDEKLNKFIVVNQNEVLDNLFQNRLYDIQQFYDELQNEMHPEKSKQMKLFLERVENEIKYRNFKKEEVKLVLYNNKESVKKIYEEINKEIEL